MGFLAAVVDFVVEVAVLAAVVVFAAAGFAVVVVEGAWANKAADDRQNSNDARTNVG
jgi:hypothetical protein